MILVVDVDPVRAGTVLVVARGECDLGGAAALRGRLEHEVAAGQLHIVADLTRVTFIDSTGLGVLVAVRRELESRGGDLRLVVGQGVVRRLLRISALGRHFALHRTLEEALAPG